MNILHTFTLHSLLKNRTRTLVTIIGIVLSMSLFTAVIEGAYSGMQFLIRSEIANTGAYHAYYAELTEEEAEQAQTAEGIRDSAVWQQVGWARLDNGREDRPYLLIESVSGNFPDLAAVRLVSGRMPENGSEILLPESLYYYGMPPFQQGDLLSLSVGKRVSHQGDVLDEFTPYSDQETVVNTRELTYTVVGTYKPLDSEIVPYHCPGHVALTCGGGTGAYRVFFTLRHLRGIYAYLAEHAISSKCVVHHSLLDYSGVFRSDNISSFVYGFAGVLVFLVSFGSISLIYNSFSISVSQRTRQFGILKSIGATRKQIRHSVLYEALLLSAIAIPIGLVVGCMGIGITLYCLRDAFDGVLYAESLIQMKLVLHPLALLIAVAVCLLTTLISAWIPASRAIRISPMDSIRQSKDLKLRGREVKTSRLTQKLFGFEGMMASKSFKRSRKGYRSTVISLFLSITLFISASSFCAYLTGAISGVTSRDTKVDITYYAHTELGVDADAIYALLSHTDGVTRSAYTQSTYISPIFQIADIENTAWTVIPGQDMPTNQDEIVGSAQLVMLDDDAFRQYCADNGVDTGHYFDPEHPAALIYNQGVVGHGQPRTFYSYHLVRANRLPVTCCMEETREIKGYTVVDQQSDENGATWYLYYPQEYMEQVWSSEEEEALDERKALRLSEEEALVRIHLTIDAIVDAPPFSMGADTPLIIYPCSMRSAVLEDSRADSLFNGTTLSFATNHHAQVYQRMEQSLLSSGLGISAQLSDQAADRESARALVMAVNVFAYGFIVLISLIAVANVFNTISTSISLRQREFAMLRSMGMQESGMRRMLNYECVIYGLKALLWGLPASLLMTYVIYRITGIAYNRGFFVPWHSVIIAVISVFLVVFVTMIYAMHKLKEKTVIDGLKNETL